MAGSAEAAANATKSAAAGAVVTGEAEADLTVPFTRSAIRSPSGRRVRDSPIQGSLETFWVDGFPLVWWVLKDTCQCWQAKCPTEPLVWLP